MTCHFSEHPLELVNLEKLENILSAKVDEKDVKKSEHCNWGVSPKCRYGMTCAKTRNLRSKMDRITDRLDILLSAYIEQTDCRDYKEILRHLQGYFPAVYRQFERNVHIKKKQAKPPNT